ncbi:MAG TPA: TonB-dependent receptor [Allosphingosinicella sp.]|nr:TonB-dependent receptor [Allosphingosinicella sp.]
MNILGRRLAGMPLGWIVAAATVGAFAAGQATAQNPTSSSPSANDTAENSGEIGEIVVTANKRSENIQKVPIAITAVTGERLSNIGVTNTQDLARVVPGLSIQNSVGGTQAHLRGVGTTAAGGPGHENSIATYIDGVYIVSTSGALVQLNNIAQVEVLKGPQGTLFGRNATGGVINIRTRDPQQTPAGDFTLRYGNYDTWSGQGYLTAGLAPNLAADIAGFVSIQGKGWGKNVANGKDVNKMNQYAVRSKWLFEPTDRDHFRLIGDFTRVTGNTFASFALLPGTAANYGPGNTTVAERAARLGPDGLPTSDALSFMAAMASGALAPFAVVGEPYASHAGFYDNDAFIQPFYHDKKGGVSLQWDHEFGDLRFTSITAYRRGNQKVAWSSVTVPADVSHAEWQLKARQFSQEVQLGSAANSNVKWVVGLYYLNATSTNPAFSILGTSLAPIQELTFHAHTSTESGAAFGQVTAPLWSGANITGGLRYSVERRGIRGDTLLAFPGDFNLTVGQVDDHKTFRKLTWRLALDQQVTPDVLVYASYNRGFKSGLYNAVPPSNVIVEPEVLDAYEVGVKTDLLDRHLRLNVSGFYYDYKNLQVTVYTPTSAVLQNGAASKIYGVDVDLTARIGPYLTLTGGGTLMHSEFTSYPQAGFFVPQPLSEGGGTIQHFASAKGNKLPYAPDFSFNAGADYAVPIGSGEADFNVNYSYVSRFYPQPDNILSQPAYGLLDGSLTYKFAGKKLEVGVWARNITKEKYHVALFPTANLGGYQNGLVGAPRTYGAMVGYKF